MSLLSFGIVLIGFGGVVTALQNRFQQRRIDELERYTNRLHTRIAQADVLIGHVRESSSRLASRVAQLEDKASTIGKPPEPVWFDSSNVNSSPSLN